MGYETALSKAWKKLGESSDDKHYSVRLLNDEYSVNLEKKEILSTSCNVPAKAYIVILILHYLVWKLNRFTTLKGEWINFKELSGGEGYYPVFKKRVLDTIKRKYGDHPEELLNLIQRFGVKKENFADISVVIDTFEKDLPLLIIAWKGDEEFGPEINLLFDKNSSEIFCTEDIVVLSEIVAHSI